MESESRMYNANKHKEVEQIPAGEVCQGAIINLEDGIAKDFIKPEAQSKFDNLEQPAINLTVEFKYQEKTFKIEAMITYFNDSEGNVMLGKKSNISKYFAFYKKLPETGDIVKLVSNAEGYFRIML